MMEWLASVFGESPLLHGPSMLAYLLITVTLTCAFALPLRRRRISIAAIWAVVATDLGFTFSWIAFHGVHSTIGIGTFFLVFVGAAAALPTVAALAIVRALIWPAHKRTTLWD